MFKAKQILLDDDYGAPTLIDSPNIARVVLEGDDFSNITFVCMGAEAAGLSSVEYSKDLDDFTIELNYNLADHFETWNARQAMRIIAQYEGEVKLLDANFLTQLFAGYRNYFAGECITLEATQTHDHIIAEG